MDAWNILYILINQSPVTGVVSGEKGEDKREDETPARSGSWLRQGDR